MRRKVKRVIDGDTFEVYRKVNGTRFIRLSGVNAPEGYNKGGLKATNILRRLISGKTVTLVPKGRSYGRVVANVGQKNKFKIIILG